MIRVLSHVGNRLGPPSFRRPPYWRPLLRAVVLVARASGAAHDLVSGRRDRPPPAAEVRQSLAGGLACGCVSREPVERVSAVGDLHAAVAAPDGAQERLAGPVDRLRLAPCRQRGPVTGAQARAGALAMPVLGKEVQRAAVP